MQATSTGHEPLADVLDVAFAAESDEGSLRKGGGGLCLYGIMLMRLIAGAGCGDATAAAACSGSSSRQA
jgi:hypothetical protein